MDISPIDLINIESFATRVIGLIDYRAKLHSYLQSKMHQVAPNLQALIGDLVSDFMCKIMGKMIENYTEFGSF